jgi:transposase-like protein
MEAPRYRRISAISESPYICSAGGGSARRQRRGEFERPSEALVTVDLRLSTKRDIAAAKAFFRKAIKAQGSTPRTVTLDGYAASHRAVCEMKAEGQMPVGTKLRSSKYLNNLIEQDRRGVKLRIGPMLGFKRFRTAAVAIAGIELLCRIYKGKFSLGRLRLKDRSASAIANGVLTA